MIYAFLVGKMKRVWGYTLFWMGIGMLIMFFVGGGLLACVEYSVCFNLTASHGRAELLEREQSLGQSHLQIDCAEIQPFQAQAAKLQPTIQIHPFERAQIRFDRGEGFTLAS